MRLSFSTVKKKPVLGGLVLLLSLSSQALAQDFVPGEIIIKLKGAPGAFSSAKFMGKAGAEGMSLKSSWGSINTYHYSLKPGEDTQAAVARLKADPDVDYVEPNYYFKKASTDDTNQVLSYSDVSSMAASQSFALTAAPIYATEAWGQMYGTDKPIVAVIDTGMDMTHPALANSLWVNTAEIPGNGIDDDGNGFIDDVNGWNFINNNGNPLDCDGHGTHVAGIIRGMGQNLLASPMPASLVRIMPLKFLDCNGNGSTSDAIRAIYYASNMGARVLNNSWGGGNYSRSLHEAILYSYTKYSLFVAAAGNSGTNNDSTPMYPAAYDVPNVISVAATRENDTLASFSNYGKGTTHIGSPGVGIFSTYLGGNFTYLSGTSMAAPIVSGIAALMMRERPQMIAYQIKQVMLANVDAKSALAGKVSTNGRVNSLKSIDSVHTEALSNFMPSYSITASSADRGLASSIASSGGGCGTVAKLYGDINKGGKPPTDPFQMMGFGFLLLVPFLVNTYLRHRNPASRRKHDRFVMNSEVRLKVGDQELVGTVNTISMGGLGINTEALLEQGSVVNMTISSPDGSGAPLQVQGHVVWAKESESYGVQFLRTDKTVLQRIRDLTANLVKAS